MRTDFAPANRACDPHDSGSEHHKLANLMTAWIDPQPESWSARWGG